MKKFIYILSAALLLAGAASMLTSCEKGHAYSYSNNKFKVATTGNIVGDNLVLMIGQPTYIYACQDNGAGAYLDGEYSGTSQDTNIASVALGSYNSKTCLALTGISPGETSVTLNLWHDGFHLYKTVKVTVH